MYHGERLNGGTHLMGAVLAAAGATVLVILAARQGDPWKIVSFSIYGCMLFALYIISLDETLRHGHGIWHLFVLAGSASHYLALLLYVA